MHHFSGPDRRIGANTALSVLVNVAINCLQTLGENAARLFFTSHHVPSTIAARVLFHPTRRRKIEVHTAASDADDNYSKG